MSTDDARARGRAKAEAVLASLEPLSDHELLTVAAAIRRLLAARGLNFTDLAGTLARPEREPETWGELARWLVENDNGRLQPHEREFASTMARRLVLGGEPSQKQGDWLRGLYARLGARNERQHAEQNSGGSAGFRDAAARFSPAAKLPLQGESAWRC